MRESLWGGDDFSFTRHGNTTSSTPLRPRHQDGGDGAWRLLAMATLLLLQVSGLFWWFRSAKASQPPAGDTTQVDTTQVIDTLAWAAQDTLAPAESLATPSAAQAKVPEVEPEPARSYKGSGRAQSVLRRRPVHLLKSLPRLPLRLNRPLRRITSLPKPLPLLPPSGRP